LKPATGQKVKKTFVKTGSPTVTTDYLDGFQYKNTVLEFFGHAEGFVANGSYVYQYKDQLGNVRMSYNNVSGTPTIINENHYYPYGLKHAGYGTNTSSTNAAHKYRYNSREWQDEEDLNLTAMDFRMYDNAIGRFYGMDALSEKNHYISPFQFGNGNPIYYSDPSGLTALKNEAISADEPYNANIELTKTASIGNYGLDFFGGGGGGSGGDDNGDGVGLDGFFLNVNNGRVESHSDVSSYMETGLLFLGDKSSSMGDIENALTYLGFEWQKNANVKGAYYVDTQSAFEARNMMLIFSPEIVGSILFTSSQSGFGPKMNTKAILEAQKKMVQSIAKEAKNIGFTVNPSKFDYFFGKVVSGSKHNIERSAQNLKDLNKMGITNNTQLYNIFKQAFKEGSLISSKSSKHGTTIMKSINVGNNGSINVGFFYKGSNMNTIPSISTIIPKTW
jgi:RHS repeat-associated protein